MQNTMTLFAIAILALLASAMSAQNQNPVISAVRDAGGTATTINDGDSIAVVLNDTILSLDLAFDVTDPDGGDQVSLTSVVTPSANITGFVQSEWDIAQAAQPVTPANPSTGTLGTAGLITIVLNAADDTTGTASLTFTIRVFAGSGSNVIQTRWDTSFAGGAGGDPSAVMFDVQVINNLEITDINSVFGTGTTDVSLYYRTGTYVGNEQTATGWTLHETVTGIVAGGAGVPVHVPLVTPLPLAGSTTYGFAILTTNVPAGPGYTSNGNPGNFSDANLQLTLGAGVTDALAATGTIFTPRVWNGALGYNLTTPTFPEIAVLRDGTTNIVDGGTETQNNTGTALFVANYTINNSGTAALNLTGGAGTEIVIGALNNCTVTPNSLGSSTIAAMGSTTFSLDITPTAAGAFSFTVSIDNNDTDENPFNWTFSGNTAATGGGGGGGGDGGGGCSTSSGNSSWLVLLAALAGLGFALRLRKSRA